MALAAIIRPATCLGGLRPAVVSVEDYLDKFNWLLRRLIKSGGRPATFAHPLHTGYVGRHPSDEERQRRIHAYLASAADEEKGAVLLALFGHAVIFLLLFAAETIWVGSTVVRVWRLRELGVTQAVRTGVHKRSLMALFAAHALYLLLRKAGIAKLDQRSIEYTTDKREAPDQ